jgi:predicted aspartyl protease
VSAPIATRLPKFARSNFFSPCFWWLALILIVCAPARAAEQRTSHSLESYLKRLGYEPIPLKRDHYNHLFLYGEIDGKSRRIGVDTGCSVTRIDRAAARKLKTIGQLGVELEDSFLGRITNGDVCLMRVKLGSAVFTNQPAWTLALDAGGESVGDCILGCDFLFRNFCLIDCLNQKLYVRGIEPSAKAEQALEESLRVSRFHEIKLLQTSALVMAVEGKADGEPIKLLLDTGAPWLLLDSKQERRLHYIGHSSNLLNSAISP